MNKLIILYDVKDTKRRNYLYRTLKDYGAWFQYSCFELELSEKDTVKLLDKIEEIICQQVDSVQIYYLCDHCLQKSRTLGVDKKEQLLKIF